MGFAALNPSYRLEPGASGSIPAVGIFLGHLDLQSPAATFSHRLDVGDDSSRTTELNAPSPNTSAKRRCCPAC